MKNDLANRYVIFIIYKSFLYYLVFEFPNFANQNCRFLVVQNSLQFQSNPINRNTKQNCHSVSYDFLFAEWVLSNPNPKIFVGDRWIRVITIIHN